MERIGFAASKIAKGNILFYNIFVVLIASLISFFIFVVSGFSIVIALLLIALITDGKFSFNDQSMWMSILRFCLTALAVLVGLLNLGAIFKNVKVK